MAKTDDKIEFLAGGDIWYALWGDDYPRMIADHIDAALYKNAIPYYALRDYTFLEYRPRNSLIAFELVLKHEKEQNSVYAFFPFCIGYENDLVLTDILGNAEDQVTEGYIKLRMNKAAAMWMFNPLFGQQVSSLSQVVGEQYGKQKFFVAGIGWDIQKTPEQKLQVSSCPFYENALQDFLKSHPDKTQKDFPFTTLDSSHMSALFAAKECQDAYDFYANIYAVKEFKCRSVKFYCLEIEVLNYSDEHCQIKEGMRVNLYVNKKSLEDYKPQVGDNINGLMQLTAYSNQEHIKENTANWLKKLGF